jgi:hypothetical protein
MEFLESYGPWILIGLLVAGSGLLRTLMWPATAFTRYWLQLLGI